MAKQQKRMANSFGPGVEHFDARFEMMQNDAVTGRTVCAWSPTAENHSA
jgi:hypothetical protein